MNRHELAVLLVRVDHAQLALKNAWNLFYAADASAPPAPDRFDTVPLPALSVHRVSLERLTEGVREFLSTGGK